MLMQTENASSSASAGRHGLAAWADRIRRALVIPKQSAQGRHIDPVREGAPDLTPWPQEQRAAYLSAEMEKFRECLRMPGKDIRDSILDDLAAYYSLPVDECLRRCVHWEEWSVREWRAGDRTTRDGLQAFYDSVQSWSFDLIWYAYLQASGYGFPASVIAARFALEHCPRGNHLDFGSGVGVTSQLFARLGLSSTLADVSKPLLGFASWRLDRHGDRATALNLTANQLPSDAFDIVTAVDTLVHVPDFDATARDLHRAMRADGWLLTNFDVREKGPEENAWHLYHNAMQLEHRLENAGFVRRMTLAQTLCYQRVDNNTVGFRIQTLGRRGSLPFRLLAASSRRIRWPTPRRLARVISRLLATK
jgi:SAM-dependent methyltransferase